MKIMDTEITPKYWLQLAKRNGISRKCYETRLKRGASYREAATKPIDPKHQHRLGKTNPNSVMQIAMAAGLSKTAIIDYRRRHPGCGLSNQQIIEKLQAYQKKRQNSISQRAKAAGLPDYIVYHRLGSGWTTEKALATPVMTRREYARLGGKARAQQIRQQRTAQSVK